MTTRPAFTSLRRVAARLCPFAFCGAACLTLAPLEPAAFAADRSGVRNLVRQPISRTSNTVGKLPSLRYDAPSFRFPVDSRARWVDDGSSSTVLVSSRSAGRIAVRGQDARPEPVIIVNYGTIGAIGGVGSVASSTDFLVADGVGSFGCVGGICGLSSASVLASSPAPRAASALLGSGGQIEVVYREDRRRRAEGFRLDFADGQAHSWRWHDWYDDRLPRYRNYYQGHSDLRGHDCWPWNDRAWWSSRRSASSADVLMEAQWLRLAQSDAESSARIERSQPADLALAESHVRAIVDRSSRGDYAGALAAALSAGDAAASAEGLRSLNLQERDSIFAQRAGWTLLVLRHPGPDAAHRREALSAAAVLGAALGEHDRAVADAGAALAAGDRSPLIAALADSSGTRPGDVPWFASLTHQTE